MTLVFAVVKSDPSAIRDWRLVKSLVTTGLVTTGLGAEADFTRYLLSVHVLQEGRSL